MADGHGSGGGSHAAHGHAKSASAKGPSPLLVLATAVFVYAFGCQKKSDDAPRAAKAPREGAAPAVVAGSEDGIRNAVHYIIEPKPLSRDVSSDIFSEKHYIFLGSFLKGAVEDREGNPVKETSVSLTHNRPIWVMLAGSKWHISPDIWQMRIAGTDRWRDSRKDEDWVNSAGRTNVIFPEFELRLAPDIAFNPLNPPEVTIKVD